MEAIMNIDIKRTYPWVGEVTSSTGVRICVLFTEKRRGLCIYRSDEYAVDEVVGGWDEHLFCPTSVTLSSLGGA